MIAAFICVFLVSYLCEGFAQPTVRTSNGDVLGNEMVSFRGRKYFGFLGVPYAQPPVGPLRFKPPEPLQDWTGVRPAIKNGNVCVQISFGSNVIHGNEDCLVLYVYSPQLGSNNTRLLPVMTFIHGGGFKYGDAQIQTYGPDFFMDYDVVLVVIQYRLGAFGFLSTGDEVSRGNYGMLDQVMALKWIQTNIAAFGGDKDKVTIFGESTGAVSVIYHLVSAASSGLFRAAIVQSGTPLQANSLQKDPISGARQLASLLNCSIDNSSILIDCIKEKSTKEIVIAAYTVISRGPLGYTPAYCPCVEDSSGGRFLTREPLTVLKEGSFNKVPIIIGINENEGADGYQAFFRQVFTFDDNFYDVYLPKLISNFTEYNRNLINVSHAVKEEYFDIINITDDVQKTQASIDFLSDMMITSQFDATVRLLAKQEIPVYMYSFNYQSSFIFYPFGLHEVSHAAELAFLFHKSAPSYSPEDLIISEKMLSMWTRFATNLKPTPNDEYMWPPTTFKENLDYLQISLINLSMAEGFITRRMQFWQETVPTIVNG